MAEDFMGRELDSYDVGLDPVKTIYPYPKYSMYRLHTIGVVDFRGPCMPVPLVVSDYWAPTCLLTAHQMC